MNDDFWFQCNPSKFLAGIDRLNEEETNAYTRIIMLYYQRGGPLPDRDLEDAQWFAGKLKISVRKWRVVRDQLLAKARIWKDEDGCIRDDQCDLVIEKRGAERATNQANGSLGGKKRAENVAKSARKVRETSVKNSRKPAENSTNANENNGPVQARLGFGFKQLESELELDNNSTTLARGARELQNVLEAEFEEHPSAAATLNAEAASHPDRDLSARELMDRCVAVAGPGLLRDLDRLAESAERIAVAVRAGCSIEQDILPVVLARTAKARARPITTFAYFEHPWAEARAARLAPPPAPPPAHAPTETDDDERTRARRAGGAAGDDRRAVPDRKPQRMGSRRGSGSIVAAALRAQAERERLARDARTEDAGDGVERAAA